mmetsp:Transcript_40576/g.112694  ORF Transcript_40576/g.112694 Transcript_40576/m.112694 type:complete len:206 (-) Transcript_40576:115-732(-)
MHMPMLLRRIAKAPMSQSSGTPRMRIWRCPATSPRCASRCEQCGALQDPGAFVGSGMSCGGRMNCPGGTVGAARHFTSPGVLGSSKACANLSCFLVEAVRCSCTAEPMAPSSSDFGPTFAKRSITSVAMWSHKWLCSSMKAASLASGDGDSPTLHFGGHSNTSSSERGASAQVPPGAISSYICPPALPSWCFHLRDRLAPGAWPA